LAHSFRSKLKKAVIPVAGIGTRMLPTTKTIPKEMLPLVDKPIIQYVVKECIDSGITEIVLVTSSSKKSIENYFDPDFEIQVDLGKKVKYEIADAIKSIRQNDVDIVMVHQDIAKGLGHAIMQAYPIVGDNPFAVLLPDVIIDKYECDHATDNLAQMIQLFEKTSRSYIMVEPIQTENISSYGIVDCRGKNIKVGESEKIFGVVEKPTADQAPSNLAVVGRYVFSESIWRLLAENNFATFGEIGLTASIASLIENEDVEGYRLKGSSYDCGSKLGYIQAFFNYSLKHGIFGKELRILLEKEILGR
jgi:UTP--glucose-1-phosphate uridylyltransferase